jgi:hypothetical protein
MSLNIRERNKILEDSRADYRLAICEECIGLFVLPVKYYEEEVINNDLNTDQVFFCSHCKDVFNKW